MFGRTLHLLIVVVLLVQPIVACCCALGDVAQQLCDDLHGSPEPLAVCCSHPSGSDSEECPGSLQPKYRPKPGAGVDLSMMAALPAIVHAVPVVGAGRLSAVVDVAARPPWFQQQSLPLLI